MQRRSNPEKNHLTWMLFVIFCLVAGAAIFFWWPWLSKQLATPADNPAATARGTLDQPETESPSSGRNTVVAKKRPNASSGGELLADPRVKEELLEQPEFSIAGWRWVDELPHELALFDTVFWDPRDTVSLRKRLMVTSMVEGKSVLEIGTGSGLLSLCSLASGATRVVATDVNLAAVANARYNADLLGLSDGFEVRHVPLNDASAFSVIGPTERFDVIISNPPWEDAKPATIDDFALYDEGFQLLASLLAGADRHLTPDGRIYLAYGCVSAIRKTMQLASKYNFECRILDDREFDQLPEVFLPGMLLELRRVSSSSTGTGARDNQDASADSNGSLPRGSSAADVCTILVAPGFRLHTGY